MCPSSVCLLICGVSSVNTRVSEKRLGLIVSLLCLAFAPLSLGDKKPSALGQKVQVLLIHSLSVSPISLFPCITVCDSPTPLYLFLWVYCLNVWPSISYCFCFSAGISVYAIWTRCWFSVWIRSRLMYQNNRPVFSHFEIIIVGCAQLCWLSFLC